MEVSTTPTDNENIEYFELAKQIPIETEEIISRIRESSSKEDSQRKVARLTKEQKSSALENFKLFIQKFKNFEVKLKQKYGDSYKLSFEYSILDNVKIALNGFRSLVVCFNCSSVIPVSTMEEDHTCEGSTENDVQKTSWLNLYATFVVNPMFKQAITELEQWGDSN